MKDFCLQKYDSTNATHQRTVEQHGLEDEVNAFADTLHLLFIDGEPSRSYTYLTDDGTWFIHESASDRVPSRAPSLQSACGALRDFVLESFPESHALA